MIIGEKLYLNIFSVFFACFLLFFVFFLKCASRFWIYNSEYNIRGVWCESVEVPMAMDICFGNFSPQHLIICYQYFVFVLAFCFGRNRNMINKITTRASVKSRRDVPKSKKSFCIRTFYWHLEANGPEVPRWIREVHRRQPFPNTTFHLGQKQHRLMALKDFHLQECLDILTSLVFRFLMVSGQNICLCLGHFLELGLGFDVWIFSWTSESICVLRAFSWLHKVWQEGLQDCRGRALQRE